MADWWTAYFEELSNLIKTTGRRYGIADISISEYLIERLDLAVRSCESILVIFENPTNLQLLTNDEVPIVQECKEDIKELSGCLRQLLEQWKDSITTRPYFSVFLSILSCSSQAYRETGLAKIRNRQGTT